LQDQTFALRQDVADLRRDIIRGFATVEARIMSEGARRAAEELEQQFREIARYYELCSAVLRRGERPPDVDLRKIVELANCIVSWLDLRLDAIAAGQAARYPLFVMRVVALRFEIDAREELDHAAASRQDEMEEMTWRIRVEIGHIAKSASIWELATTQHDLLDQYVLLNRALTAPPTLIETTDGRFLAYAPRLATPWDDGLTPPRRLLRQ
jgi:hypothetical protein